MTKTDLTLPGSIPGLLRLCSPVIGPRGHSSVMLEACGGWQPALLSSFSLDLSDATGRAHAAWWLAKKEGLNLRGGITWDVERHREDVYSLRVTDVYDSDRWWYHPRSVYEGHHVPALANLDPNDPRTLPDGTRHVDAEALRLVCLHVAKVES